MCGRASSSASAPASNAKPSDNTPVSSAYLPGRFVETQIAERGQRVGQTVDGRFGQAGAFDEITIAQQGFARPERAQHLQAACERDDEFAFIESENQTDRPRWNFGWKSCGIGC